MNKLTIKMFIMFSALFIGNSQIIADGNDTAAALLYFMNSGDAGYFSITNAGPATPVTIEDIEWNYCSNNTEDRLLNPYESYNFSWAVAPVAYTNCALKRIRFRVDDANHYAYYYTFGNAIVPVKGSISCSVFPNKAKGENIECYSRDVSGNQTVLPGKSIW